MYVGRDLASYIGFADVEVPCKGESYQQAHTSSSGPKPASYDYDSLFPPSVDHGKHENFLRKVLRTSPMEAFQRHICLLYDQQVAICGTPRPHQMTVELALRGLLHTSPGLNMPCHPRVFLYNLILDAKLSSFNELSWGVCCQDTY